MRDVRAQLDEFLAHKQKKVLMLKGKWGVGKTYFWKEYIGSKKADNFQEKKYSYVSLFGVGSTEEVEQLVLSKTVDLKDKDLVSGVVGKSARVMDWAKEIPQVKDWLGLVRRIGSLFVKEYLVCLDDVERRDATLTMGALLGFASVLKEENNCRIVLILNEQELSEADKAELQKYREKVVDEEITYEPTVEENVRIIFGDRPDFDVVQWSFRRLNLNNERGLGN